MLNLRLYLSPFILLEKNIKEQSCPFIFPFSLVSLSKFSLQSILLYAFGAMLKFL